MDASERTRPRSLVIATDIDVLPSDATVTRTDGHLIVRTPSNPTFWWGNFLVFDDPPGPGDAARWEAAYDTAFGDEPNVRHIALTWDRADTPFGAQGGDPGASRTEFVDRGYRLEHTVGLTAAPSQLHSDCTPEVEIRALDPAGDEDLWSAHIEMHLADHDPAHDPPPAEYEAFIRQRQRERRALFAAGRGAWYVALDRATGALAAACGVVATGPRGRYQDVHTSSAYRRRGIAARLVTDAGIDAAAHHGLATLVIAADAEYHALGLYESLGFRRTDRLTSVVAGDRRQLTPRSPAG